MEHNVYPEIHATNVAMTRTITADRHVEVNVLRTGWNVQSVKIVTCAVTLIHSGIKPGNIIVELNRVIQMECHVFRK
jgi:hypothetical protein